MKPSEVIEHFGTQQATARALGIAQSSVAEWASNGRVPLGRQYQLQVLTGGLLKADVPSKQVAA